MSEVTYDNFLVEVMPYVRDVPEVVAIQAIRNACIQFCQETRYIQDNLDPMAGVSNISKYELTPNDGTYKIADIVEMWYGDSFLVPKSIEQLTQIYRSTNWNTLGGNPYYYFRPSSQEIQLVPYPQVTEAKKIRIRAALTPSRVSTGVREEIYERFLEDIAYGARARLYNTPNQPYYDLKTSLVYLKRFNDVIADVRTQVNKGLTRASVQIEFQRFA
tara:strand:+ start:304 stop:954 length:651 start_codon:yes stop_codon:yes gene_type:complete